MKKACLVAGFFHINMHFCQRMLSFFCLYSRRQTLILSLALRWYQISNPLY